MTTESSSGTLLLKILLCPKLFFIVIPYNPVQIPKAGKKAVKKFLGLFRTTQLKEGGSPQFEENLKQLDLRVDQVVAGLNRIRIRAVPLTETEMIELFNFLE